MQTRQMSFATGAAGRMMHGMHFHTLTIPGWRNSGPGHWQALWEATLPPARRVEQSDWVRPDPAIWHGTLAQAVGGFGATGAVGRT